MSGALNTIPNLTEYDFFKKITSLDCVEEIWLFGSRSRGDCTDRSDIDLAILCPKATDQEWCLVLEIIESADTLLKIDCIRFDLLPVHDVFRKNIIDFRKVLYKRGGSMAELFWKDYFDTLGQAITRLKEVMEHPDLNNNDFMPDAAIQRFEFVTELFWKVLKKILAYEKIDAITPRDVISKAYQNHLIDDESIWLSMLTDRNNTPHVYRAEEARKVFMHINAYLSVFMKTYEKLGQSYQLL